MPANSVFDDPIINFTVNTVYFDRSPFICSCEQGKKSHNHFKVATFIGHFPSDDATSTAVKGLTQSDQLVPSVCFPFNFKRNDMVHLI